MIAYDKLGATLAAQPDLAGRIAIGLTALEARYRAGLDAIAPPNRAFERERIIACVADPRELAFAFGLLSEGENEAALILALVADLTSADPQAAVDHLLDEAWYYLRISIDPGWQLDDGRPSATAAILYLAQTLDTRIAAVRARPVVAPIAGRVDVSARRRLCELRAMFAP